MSIVVTEEIISRNAYKFEMKLKITKDSSTSIKPGYSSQIDINDMVVFQAMFFDLQTYTIQCLMKFSKKQENDKFNYRILLRNTLESDTSKVYNKQFTTDDSWHSLGDKININHHDYAATYIIKIETEIAPSVMSYTAIYKDLDHTDFELRGVNGSVRMHKAVAAACCPFFKTLFAGSWKETAAGIVDVPDVSVTTLQHLKDYIYIGKVPETDLKPLLLLSSCYMMEDLAKLCTYVLARDATADTVIDLIEFALKHKQYQLLIEILQLAANGGLKLDEMRTLYKTK